MLGTRKGPPPPPPRNMFLTQIGGSTGKNLKQIEAQSWASRSLSVSAAEYYFRTALQSFVLVQQSLAFV